MAFKDIKGQEFAVNYLKQIILKKRIPPTLLFVGKKGTGRFLTALTFAKALNCENETNDSCDKCDSCVAIQSGVHPNVKVMGRKEEKIAINDIRNMISSSFVPLKNGFKANIIDNADKSTIQAFNSMLKYLEEPPENTVNILIAQDENTIPETIRSRSVKIKFNSLPAKIIEEILKERGISSDRAYLVSHIANGSLNETDRFTSNEFLTNRKEFILAILKFLKNEETVPALLSKWSALYPDLSQKDSAEKFFDTVSQIIRDILLISILKEKENIVNIDFSGYIAERFSIIRKSALEKIFDIINTEKEALLTNANAQYIMMDGIFRIKEVIK